MMESAFTLLVLQGIPVDLCAVKVTDEMSRAKVSMTV